MGHKVYIFPILLPAPGRPGLRAASRREISSDAVRWSEIKPAPNRIAPKDSINGRVITP